jgi:hypothetical protein
VRVVASVVVLTGFATAAAASASEIATTRRSCAAIAPAVARAATWLAAFPADDLRFDAAIILSQLRRTVDGEPLARAFATARAVADHDDDNPQRRFWIPEFTSPPEHTSRWVVPRPGEPRVNTNRVLIEALHCGENGWRPETMAYLCGPMRDAGGYQSTHALWALDLARRRGCVASPDFHRCARPIALELEATERAPLAPKNSLDLDLFAERLLVLALAGWPLDRLDPWAAALQQHQQPDGTWTVPGADEPAYHRYHATAMTAWALAEWCRRRR